MFNVEKTTCKIPSLYNNFESIKKGRGFFERYPRKVTLNLKIPKNQKQ